MATPIIAGVAVAGAAMLGRAALILVRGGGSGVGAAAGAKAASWLTFGAGAKGAANMGAARGLPRIPRAYQGPFEADMTRAEALKVLGIREGASRDAIRDSHRRLMRLNHPDTGGSPALATKINEAKDFLLSGRRGML
ncbi:Mitochondrial import inner membrane translocase subunit TIM14-1 [Porphyridium purpureum]|uniref:Mitochondrial import inner membrane translocase subunit TIM14-1 n=1 Tax=Porphyridium purpureum TaxID=35688 RepID=A0A5J4YWU3_PORPP|nr:Mitochondrial import inner membrane translocase subunit TIM14-1 [Porphyridium purpureum]|eukprot:POR7756..scf209_3